MSLNQKQLPYAENIEKAVIGGLLSSNEAFDEIGDILKPESFYPKKHQVIFDVISKLHQANQSHDVIGVSEYIKGIDQKLQKEKKNTQPNIALIGGIEYLYSIFEEFDTYSNIRSHAKIIQRYHTLRRLIEVSNKIHELGTFPEEQNTEELINKAEHLVFEIGQEKFNAGKIQDSIALANQVQKTYEERRKVKGLSGLDTGFKDLNERLLGLQKGSLNILAARPGVGKTAFALNLTINAVKATNKSVLFFSLEMTGEELMRRMIAGEGKVSITEIMRGDLNDSNYAKFNRTITKVQKLAIDVDESGHLNPIELLSRSRRVFKSRKESKNPLGLIIVDYIQLMSVPWIKDNRVREISEITRNLKILAKELQIPVLALSQLNREIEKQAGGKPPRAPRLSDLRDSGSIEQDADVVLFIERTLKKDFEETNSKEVMHNYSMAGSQDLKKEIESKNTISSPSQAYISIAKNRHGETGKFELFYAEKYTKFMDKDSAEYIKSFTAAR